MARCNACITGVGLWSKQSSCEHTHLAASKFHLGCCKAWCSVLWRRTVRSCEVRHSENMTRSITLETCVRRWDTRRFGGIQPCMIEDVGFLTPHGGMGRQVPRHRCSRFLTRPVMAQTRKNCSRRPCRKPAGVCQPTLSGA